VEHKLELRRNLNEKKEIAAKQFFQLTKEYIEQLEQEFWEKFEQEAEEERRFEAELNSQLEKMQLEQRAVEPTLQAMQENVEKSHFIDIIESKAEVWQMNTRFEQAFKEFTDLVDNAKDWELIFDKLECKLKLEEYLKVQLAVKVHQ
jgi:hypothetical protein